MRTAGLRSVACLLATALAACGAPLREQAVTVERPSARLRGTLFAPDVRGRLPAVLLLHGSGPDGRDNPYYRQLAESFGRRGIATLVYDKRGSGESTGDWRVEPFTALIDDAEAALRVLRAHPWVDPTRVGIWGGSEGATIAPLVAARAPGTAFVILQSMSGVPFGDQYLHQAAREFRGRAADSVAAVELVRAKLAYVRDRTRWPAYDSLVRASAGRSFSAYASPVTEDSWWWRWYATKLDVSALPVLRSLRSPTLAIWGAVDVLVPAEASRDAFVVARAPAEERGDAVWFIEGASHTLHVPGVRGLVAGAGLRNRPVHLREMAAWAAERVRLP